MTEASPFPHLCLSFHFCKVKDLTLSGFNSFYFGRILFQATFYMEAERGNRKEGSLGGGDLGFPTPRGQMFVPCTESWNVNTGIVQPQSPTHCGSQAWVRTGPVLWASVGLGQEPALATPHEGPKPQSPGDRLFWGLGCVDFPPTQSISKGWSSRQRS